MEEPNFDWSLGEETETTSGEEQGNEDDGTTAVEEQSGARERDAQGRFVAKESGESVEADANGDEAAAEDQQGLILGKFKSVEALQEAYGHLEKLVGSKGSEVGELRAELNAIKAALTEQNAGPEYAPVDNQTVDALDELAASNPKQAADWALQYQPLLYDRVMETWFQNDPRGASRYETALTMNAYQTELARNLAPALQPVVQQTQQHEFSAAWANVAEKYPDMEQHADAMLEAAQGVPEIVAVLQNGDSAAKERMIENLLFLARGRQADTTAAARTAQAQQAEADKLRAAVASGSSTQSRGEKTGIAAWKERFLAEPSTSIWQGLETKK